MRLGYAVLLSLLVLSISVGLFSANTSGTARSPVIVAQRSLLQRTGQIAVVLLTPKVTGDYRVSIYQNQQASPYGPIIQMSWTDELGTEQTDSGGSVCPIIVATTQTVSGCQLFLHAVGGFPIQLNTYVNPAQPPYNVYVTVEGL